MLGWAGQLIVFLVGGMVGAGLDHLHVLFGVLTYPPRAYDLIITPSFFGVAALAMTWPYRLVFRRAALRWQSPVPTLLYIGVFAGAYALTAVGKNRPELVALVLIGAWIPLALASPGVGLYGGAMAIVGPIVEATLQKLGTFHYVSPGLLPVLRVPIWLPFLYLHASLAARGLDMVLFHAHRRYRQLVPKHHPRPSPASRTPALAKVPTRLP